MSAGSQRAAQARISGIHRIRQACEPCREKKTKCNGARPECERCLDLDLKCRYMETKSDRTKRQRLRVMEKLANYEALLKDLSSRVTEGDAHLIRLALGKERYRPVDEVLIADTGNAFAAVDREDRFGGNTIPVSGPSRAFGGSIQQFHHKNAASTSSVQTSTERVSLQWLIRLLTRYNVSVLPAASHPNSNISDTGYHCSDNNPLLLLEAVDPYDRPPLDTAQHLFDIYMGKVQVQFPFMDKITTTVQFHNWLTVNTLRPPEPWLVIINLILAIGAKHAQLDRAGFDGSQESHILYFSRACVLARRTDTVFDHPRLQAIQAAALNSIYFLCTEQIGRAWSMAGLAVRWATCLGLNMGNGSSSLKDSLKETRYRLWWALYSLEHHLAIMTGRASCILDDYCTAPLPAPLEEAHFDTIWGVQMLSTDSQRGPRAPLVRMRSPRAYDNTPLSNRCFSSAPKAVNPRQIIQYQQNTCTIWAKDLPPNPSLFFLYLVQIIRIRRRAFHMLHLLAIDPSSRTENEGIASGLSGEIEDWYHSLPPTFDFWRKQMDMDDEEFRLSLAFLFHDTKLIIHRLSP